MMTEMHSLALTTLGGISDEGKLKVRAGADNIGAVEIDMQSKGLGELYKTVLSAALYAQTSKLKEYLVSM